jgi:hypothetical protein
MKNIIWVDDNMGKMAFLAKYLFPKLWNKNYFNYIIFAGNHYAKDNSNISRSERARKDFNNDMSSYFDIFCRSGIDDDDDDDTPMKEWNSKKSLYPKWDVIDKLEDHIIEREIKNKIDELFKEDTFIGIDLCLLIKDEEQKDETLAMKLFDFYFFEKEIKNTFLYSNFKNEKAEKKEWVNKFIEHHKDIEHQKDTIIIYSGYDLAKKSSGEELKMFLEFLEPGSIN